MNRSRLTALGLAGALALVAAPVAAQHRRDGEERGGNAKEQRQEHQESRRQERQEPRQQAARPAPQAQTRPAPQAQTTQPAVPPPVPRNEERAVPRQGFERSVPQQQSERAVPRQGVERTVPQQGAERAIPRQDVRPGPRGDNRNDNNWRSDNRRSDDNRRDFNGRYDNRRYGYAAPRYVGPRYYSGRYNGPRYVGPRFTVAPRRFYRPYYAFRPRVNIGFGLWIGYPVTYYDPFYYPYDYYPYASTPGYVVPTPQSNMGGLSFSVTPDTAEIWVDGNYFGTVGQFAPDSQPLGLPAGRHQVELREPGYQVSSFEVDIIPGQVIPFQGALEP